VGLLNQMKTRVPGDYQLQRRGKEVGKMSQGKPEIKQQEPVPEKGSCSRRQFIGYLKQFVITAAAYEVISLVPFVAGCDFRSRDAGDGGNETPKLPPKEPLTTEKPDEGKTIQPSPPEKELKESPAVNPKCTGACTSACTTCTGCVGCTTCTACTFGT